MTYDLTAQKLAIKAIGTVESNLNYISINYNDPITVGFFQWYGTRAAGLLNRIRTENPSSWVGVATSLTGDLDSHPATESWWTTRYLSRDEGESLKTVLNNNKGIQNAQAIADVDVYANVARTTLGMDLDGNTPAVLFFFVMYHQSPKRALAVVRDVGPSGSIDRMYDACLNETVLGRYRTRYTTARDIIKSGDTSGIDDVPGTVPPPSPDGGDPEGETISRTGGDINHAKVWDDQIEVIYADGKKLRFYHCGGNVWKPVRNSSIGADVPPSPGNPDPEVPPDSEAASKRQALVDFVMARLGRYAYKQGATRLNPEQNMYTDCSGLMYYTFQTVLGINIGTFTGSQYNNGGAALVSSGNGPPVPQDVLLPGDLVFFDWNNYTGNSGYPVDHVEMYIGGGQIVGHGSGQGPKTKTLSSYGPPSRIGHYYVRRWVR